MQPNEWRNKTVGMSTDGASVVIGKRNGVVTRINADVCTILDFCTLRCTSIRTWYKGQYQASCLPG